MSNKILVKLIVPYLDGEYELFIPINKRISTIIKLLEKALNEMSNGYYMPKEDTLLIDGGTGNAFDVNITVKDTRLYNGAKIILL